MAIYNTHWFNKFFTEYLQRDIPADSWEWLNIHKTKFNSAEKSKTFLSAFTLVPRYTGKAGINLTPQEKNEITENYPGFPILNYTIDRLARVWLLLNFPAEEKDLYVSSISQLFKNAEVNEQVALYAALPFLSYPEDWIKQSIEGIRSNIGVVLEAIMCDNPYPAQYLQDPAWNQLVLKAFFTEKPVNKIVGLDTRANKQLALTLMDYVHERRAANREINPQLWRLVGKFMDDTIFTTLKKVFTEGTENNKKAAALSLSQSAHPLALELLHANQHFKLEIESKKLNWDTIV